MSILTPYEWDSLEHPELQKVYFKNLLNKVGVEEDGWIYRPIKPLPEHWMYCETELFRTHPKGECYKMTDVLPTFENYKLLYSWMKGACHICMNESLVWNLGAEPIIGYYCRYCGKKTPFIRCDNF